MATIKQLKNELRHKRWAEEIAECQNSGTKISEWCQIKGISCNTYYRRLQIVRNEFVERSESPLLEIIPLSIATTPTRKALIMQNLSVKRIALPAVMMSLITVLLKGSYNHFALC